MARWLTTLVLGITVGAAAILLADPGDGPARRVATPAAASSSEESQPVALNGQHVHGVKALDIAAEAEPDQPLDGLTRSALADQLTQARDVAMRYPTYADAVAAGFRLAGGFAPGSGAHMINLGGVGGTGPVDVSRVNSFIYDGTSPTSRIVGLMYYSQSSEAPEGFAGPNDHWHRHSNVCVKFTGGEIEVPFPADAEVTRKQCQGQGGNLLAVTGYMLHVWVVPGWESPQGVFSHDNPNLRCADGTYETNTVGFCQGT